MRALERAVAARARRSSGRFQFSFADDSNFEVDLGGL
jgi:hypothetical protein